MKIGDYPLNLYSLEKITLSILAMSSYVGEVLPIKATLGVRNRHCHFRLVPPLFELLLFVILEI